MTTKKTKPAAGPVANKELYIDAGGTECPFCFDHDIVGEAIEIDDGVALQPMSCSACDAEWTDIYRLADIKVTLAPPADLFPPVKWRAEPAKVCTDCKQPIELLADFPGPRCLKCHARKVENEPLERPDFRSAIKGGR